MANKKTFTMKEALERIKNSPKPPVVNDHLKKHLTKIASELFAKKYRKEALDILFKSDEKRIGEFLYYYYSDSSNVACLVVDSAKDDLVKSGKLKNSKEDLFGFKKPKIARINGKDGKK